MEKKHTFELQQTWQHLEEVANLKYELLVLKFESSNDQLLLVNQAATFADLLRAENLKLTKVIKECNEVKHKLAHDITRLTRLLEIKNQGIERLGRALRDLE